MSHDHLHSDEHLSDGRLVAAIALNLLLTIVEVLAGVLSGSLALVADGAHNFSDCTSLIIALVARRIARFPSDERRTFGYRRVEIIGALINLTALVLVGLYLVMEAFYRLFAPRPIEGWTVVIVACVALAIDVATAALLFAMSRANLNLRAAFLHNVGDALGSVGVIVAGAAVLLFGAAWLDAVVTLAIAVYILWQSLAMMARSILILLDSVPPDVNLGELVAELHQVEGVAGVHHVHVREMDELHRTLEAHVVVESNRFADWPEIKTAMKARLREKYNIGHSTLEFETPDEAACEVCPPGTPHVH